MYVLKKRKEAGARRQLREERVNIFYNNFSCCEGDIWDCNISNVAL
jgi:hypothetical protein